MLVLGVAALVYASVPGARASPANDQGCYCHNNGIGVWLNGTGFMEFGILEFTPGGSMSLNVTSSNIAATGVVPGVQDWMANENDTGKFTIAPQSVQDGSAEDLAPATGNITVIYRISAPTTPGSYLLTLYVQGTWLTVAASVGSPSGTTTTSTSSGGSTTHSTSTTTKGSSNNFLAGFPGLNLITLIVTSGIALAIGVVLGVGVALRDRKARSSS